LHALAIAPGGWQKVEQGTGLFNNGTRVQFCCIKKSRLIDPTSLPIKKITINSA
jgi:hypothetical protein